MNGILKRAIVVLAGTICIVIGIATAPIYALSIIVSMIVSVLQYVFTGKEYAFFWVLDHSMIELSGVILGYIEKKLKL